MDNKEHYAIVFDMDETLGSFSQLYIFWNLTKLFLKEEDLPDKYFFSILDLFVIFFEINNFSKALNQELK